MSARLPSSLEFAASSVAGAARAILPAIANASARTGVDFSALYNTARLESGFNPVARARTSSATGLFQFIDSSWMAVLAKHGAKHGLTPANRAEALALRNDPAAASLMAAEHMADNAEALESSLGRPAEPVDLYLAHFLGAGGAIRFLRALQSGPDQSASGLMPAAAKANRAIFFEGGRARSLSDVHTLFTAKLAAGGAGANAGPTAPMQGRGASGLPQPNGIDALPATPMRATDAIRLAYLLLADMGA